MSSRSFLSGARFADLPIDPRILKALTGTFGYERMSEPQSKPIPVALEGKDVFVKVRTGSGKTLGFLIPVVNALSDGGGIKRTKRPTGPPPILALVLSPSRELADQTRREAERLLSAYDGAMGVQMVIGGTDPQKERRRLTAERCDVLVATPGRLLDHLESTPGFRGRLSRLRVLVLDEADRLLDMGFASAIRKIAGHLPAPDARQTLLFTTTVPDSVRQVADAFMRKDHVFVDTGGGSSKSAAAAAARIRQESLVLPPGSLLRALHGVLSRKRAERADHMIIVFATTARMAQLLAALFRASGMPDALELHSRLSQAQRNAVTRSFAASNGVLLFASDVIVRGIDFPDVTLVVQLGLTDRQQYEHRVGRTGRAGKSGEALIILADDERSFLTSLVTSAAPVTPSARDSIIAGGVCDGDVVPVPAALQAAEASVGTEGSALNRTAAAAFVATLGFYNSNLKRLGWTQQALVAAVVARFVALGLRTPPAIPASTLEKMNMFGTPGLSVSVAVAPSF